jgi:hypothetical protein
MLANTVVVSSFSCLWYGLQVSSSVLCSQMHVRHRVHKSLPLDVIYLHISLTSTLGSPKWSVS